MDCQRSLSPALVQRLAELAKRENATLFMVSLAALLAVLRRHTGQEDLSIGTAVSNRQRAEFESVVGPFVNTLVLRTHVPGELTARERFDRFREFTEALDVLLRFERGTGRGVSYSGDWFSAVGARMVGEPAQEPRTPFLIAANGPRSMRLVAR